MLSPVNLNAWKHAENQDSQKHLAYHKKMWISLILMTKSLSWEKRNKELAAHAPQIKKNLSHTIREKK